jgi:integrase
MGKRGNGEGSIYQDARGLWRASVWIENGKRKYLSGRTRQDVARKLAAALQAREQGTIITAPRQTVGQFFTRWLEDVVKPNLRPRSYAVYEGKTRLHIVPELGRLPMTALTPQHLQRLYAQKQAEGLAPKSVNNLHVVIHRALTYALRWGVVARNVAEAVEPPRVPVRELEPFTPEEIAILLEAVRGHRHERLWITMLATGIRFGEAAALRWADVDLDGRVIHVRHTLGPKGKNAGPRFAEPKTNKGRRDLPLPAIAVEVLRLQLAETQLARELIPGWHDLGLVFPSGLGTPLNESHVLARFQRVLAGAGLPKRRMHDLRHTYATRLFALGQHPRAVQDLLGHSRFEITMNLYTATVPEVLREAADRMDSVFANARRQLGAPAVAAQPAGRAHREATPGRVAARVAAQKPAKNPNVASDDAI